MRTFLILTTLSSLLLSCSPQKRLSRLILLHPELVKQDTVFRYDTTIFNGVAHDTIFKTQITKDTIVLIDKQLTIKYYNDGKTTYLKGVCDTIKIIKEIPVVVNKVSPVQVVYALRWWDYVARAISILTILFIIFDQISARKEK